MFLRNSLSLLLQSQHLTLPLLITNHSSHPNSQSQQSPPSRLLGAAKQYVPSQVPCPPTRASRWFCDASALGDELVLRGGVVDVRKAFWVGVEDFGSFGCVPGEEVSTDDGEVGWSIRTSELMRTSKGMAWRCLTAEYTTER